MMLAPDRGIAAKPARTPVNGPGGHRLHCIVLRYVWLLCKRGEAIAREYCAAFPVH